MKKTLLSFSKVFSQKKYFSLALLIAVTSYVVVILGQQFGNILSFWKLPVTLINKLSFVIKLFGNTTTSMSILGATLMFLMIIFFSINLVLTIYYIRHHRIPQQYKKTNTSKKASVTSIAGVVAAVFGIGCAACGAALLGSLLSLLGAGGVIAFLPLHGSEVSIIALLLLGYGSYTLLKHISKSPVCDIEITKP